MPSPKKKPAKPGLRPGPKPHRTQPELPPGPDHLFIRLTKAYRDGPDLVLVGRRVYQTRDDADVTVRIAWSSADKWPQLRDAITERFEDVGTGQTDTLPTDARRLI